MKSLLKFLGVIIVLFIWAELINFSFYLMNLSDTLWFYVGFFMMALITVCPIFYFGDNIVMFLKNMKGVFTDKDEEEKKDLK
jgi:hypothetical protein